MRIVIDTAEKKPWPFPNPVRKKLTTGDYSVAGLEHIVRIERKGCDEIWSMVGSDRDRFLSQLERLGKFPIRALIIEGTVEDIIHRPGFSQVSYTNFMYRLMSWTTKFGIPVWFLGKRCKATLALVEEFFAAIDKNYRNTRGFKTQFSQVPLTPEVPDGLSEPTSEDHGHTPAIPGNVHDSSGNLCVGG